MTDATCPNCGSLASAHVVDNVLQWRCVDGCGMGGQTPLGPEPGGQVDDTELF
jgi:hypothetical protein